MAAHTCYHSYLIINVSDVHAVGDVKVEVVLHHTPQDVKGDVGPVKNKQTFSKPALGTVRNLHRTQYDSSALHIFAFVRTLLFWGSFHLDSDNSPSMPHM